MVKVGLLRNACFILVICAATAVAAAAQSFTTLYNFDLTDGATPTAGLIQATDGNFYGTTSAGGTYANCDPGILSVRGCGTVFKITPAGELTTLYNFCAQTNCADGADPRAGLIQATDGNFYGTTGGGGFYGSGTVFKITPTGELTTLYNFCAQTNCADGANSGYELIQATDGNFYGTTWGGGTSTNCLDGSYGTGCGTVFKITPAGALTTLYNFCPQPNCADGLHPAAGLIQAADGNFYGTTINGGSDNICNEFPNRYGCGTVFKITTAGVLTTLHSFDQADGQWPSAGLIQATDGNFYGTTRPFGPINDYGTVFKITPGGALTTLHTFCFPGCHDGEYPRGGLIQATDGNFYGTTMMFDGGRGCGTVFEVTDGGTLAILHSFDCIEGGSPFAGLVQATDGNFYGTTGGGGTSTNCGAHGCGTVFRLTVAPAATLTPTSFSFGNQALSDTSSPKTVTLKNSGTALLTVSGVAIDDSGFAISANTCGGVAVGLSKTCKVSVTFTPPVLGKLTGTLIFTDNASNSPQTVSLSGAGVVAATLTPISFIYGQQAVGTSSMPKSFILANNQSVSVDNIAISTTGDFAVSATTCTASLAAKSKCTIGVSFTPTVPGKRTGMLTVIDGANNSPQTASLTGTGAVAATLTPTGVWYASQAVGTTSLPKTFTLINNQSVELTRVAISTTGDFAVSATTCTTSLASKSKCTISLTFTPTATGTRTGKLSVSDSANNSPQTSNLSGTGK